MNGIRLNRPRVWFSLVFAILLTVSPLFAKTVVDFDPKINFLKYKTFAFVGGVENLLMFEVNPGLVSERVHRAVNRELTQKGLHEVQVNQNPDLLVRFWANPSSQVNVATMGEWGAYRPYIDSYWARTYQEVSASGRKEGALLIDLVDPKSKTLVWRLYLIHKITTPDKEWKKADEELSKGFESYPPSEREKQEKQKEREAHPPQAD